MSLAQQPSREQEQIRRLRQQLQREQANVAEMERKAVADKQQAGEERAALEQKLQRAQTQAASRVAELEKGLGASQSELAAVQARLAESQLKSDREMSELRQRLVARDADYAKLEASHKRQAEQLQTLMRNNAALYKLGLELLDRYRRKDVAEAMADQEPFLQLKRVQLENLVQDYEDRLLKERFPSPQAR